MESVKNVTFKEIKIGDSATITRRLTSAEVEALQIGNGQKQAPAEVQTQAVGVEALLSGLLNRKLPGPGTSITSQDLSFEGSVHPGDELVATVTARQKKAKGNLVVFDCQVRSED